MTDRQKSYYWRLWRACQAANRWYTIKGRLQIDRGRLTAQGGQVLGHAEALAQQAHRAITLDDLRHGCHIAALGHDKSMLDLTNADFDRVLSVMRLVQDGEDLDAAKRLVNPKIGTRARLIHSIASVPDEFVRHIAADRFGTRLWEDLDTPQLHQLRMTLGHTRYGRASQPLPAGAMAPDPECPF